jgi:hypothetical protein
MDTKELSATLRSLADFLDSRPVFELESGMSILTSYTEKTTSYGYISFYDRDTFVAAVKAIGSATKHYTDGDYPKLEVVVDAFPLKLSIARDKVCRKVVTFECDPLFSEEEVRNL